MRSLSAGNCIFAKGDCWHGGGLFKSSKKYWLNDGYGHEIQQDDRQLKRTTEYPWHESYGGECPGVYYIRLQRDGWTMRNVSDDGQCGGKSLFEKPIHNHWILRKFAHATLHRPEGRGVYYDTHALWNRRTEEVISQPEWEWAELDGNRLVWAEKGCLYASGINAKGLYDEHLLYDFTSMKFERIAAPYQ